MNRHGYLESVTDICNYHFPRFVTIILVKVISDHLVKIGQSRKKSGYRVVIHVFRSDFARNAINDTTNTFLKCQNRSIF